MPPLHAKARRAGCVRIGWDELISPLAEHIAAEAGRDAPHVVDEDKARELLAVAWVLVHRHDGEVRPGAGSHHWWAGQLVNVLLARLEDDETTQAEGRHNHRARHRGCRRARLLGYRSQLAARTRGGNKTAAQRWAKKVLDSARRCDLIRGNHAVGYYLPTWGDAISTRRQRKVGCRPDPFIKTNTAPAWLKKRLGVIRRHAAVGTPPRANRPQSKGQHAAVGTQKELSTTRGEHAVLSEPHSLGRIATTRYAGGASASLVSSSCAREVPPGEALEAQADCEVDQQGELEPAPDQEPPRVFTLAVTDSEFAELADEGLLLPGWHRGQLGPAHQELAVPTADIDEVERGLRILRGVESAQTTPKLSSCNTCPSGA
ncbi:MAG: hypothetical protein NXI35_14635 [bacterium]|nr:hypothetical protein [bacterium]